MNKHLNPSLKNSDLKGNQENWLCIFKRKDEFVHPSKVDLFWF